MKNYFNGLDNGASGGVIIHQDGDYYHVINVVKKDNVVYFIDGQRGQIVELDPKLNVQFGDR